jgi:hypothetical protein
MWEREVNRFAREHHGLINWETAVELGGSRHLIRHRVSTGRWNEFRPTVYYLNVTPATWRTDVLAAVMAAGPDAVASHRTAARLFGLEGIGGHPLDVTVPYAESPEPRGVIVHRTRRPLDIGVIDSIPVTTVERTLLDLAAILGERILEKLVASAFRKRLTTPEKLDSFIGHRGGRGVAGTRRLRKVLCVVEGDRSGSFAEVDLGQLIRQAPIPQPVQQLRVVLPDGTIAYLDFAWPDRRRLAEVDSIEAHATQEQLAHDLNRQNQLMDIAWDLRRFPARRVRLEPQAVIEELTRFVNKPFTPHSVNADG